MFRTVPIFALAFTVSVAAIVLSAKRPAPSADSSNARASVADSWFV